MRDTRVDVMAMMAEGAVDLIVGRIMRLFYFFFGGLVFLCVVE